LTALLPSIELARDELRQQGPTLDEKAVHRIARQLGAEALTARTRQLQRYREGRLAAGHDLDGQHVVAQLDGGRVRTRIQIETTKRKGVKYRRKIRLEWREPVAPQGTVVMPGPARGLEIASADDLGGGGRPSVAAGSAGSTARASSTDGPSGPPPSPEFESPT
jgi:hypothetical protein